MRNAGSTKGSPDRNASKPPRNGLESYQTQWLSRHAEDIGDSHPRFECFIENKTTCSVSLSGLWLAGDAQLEDKNDTKKVIEERECITIIADQTMGGILCFSFESETVAIAFQSIQSPPVDFDEKRRTNIDRSLLEEWLVLSLEHSNEAFVCIIGDKPRGCNVTLNLLAEGVGLVAKLSFGLNYQTLAISGVKPTTSQNQYRQFPESTGGYGQDEKKGSPRDANFANQAKALLNFVPGLGTKVSMDIVLEQMDRNRELGQKSREAALAVYSACLKLPVDMGRFGRWKDDQKSAFLQMIAMCMANLYRQQMVLTGDVYPEVSANLSKVQKKRHDELLTLFITLMQLRKNQVNLEETVRKQYEMHCDHAGDSSDPKVADRVRNWHCSGNIDTLRRHSVAIAKRRMVKLPDENISTLEEEFPLGSLGVRISPEAGIGWLVTSVSNGTIKSGQITGKPSRISPGAVLTSIDEQDVRNVESEKQVRSVLSNVEGETRKVVFFAAADQRGGDDGGNAVEVFLKTMRINSDNDKYCLLRDLTSLTLASGCFDATVLGFLKLLSVEMNVVPEAIDSWALDAGKNIWEAYQSAKGAKRAGTPAWKIAAGVTAGGLALGLTGGLAILAAPAAFGAVGSAVGGGVATAAGLVGLQGAGAAAAVTGAFASTAAFLTAVGPAGGLLIFGTTGMGLTGYKLKNRWGDLSNFDFVSVRPESPIASVTIWIDADIEQIELKLEDGSNVVYGSHSEHAESDTLDLAKEPEKEYIIGIRGSPSKNADGNALCENLKIQTNLRTRNFAGSAHKNRLSRVFKCVGKNALKSFRFHAPASQAIEGFDFHRGTCLRTHFAPMDPEKAETRAGAVNWTLFVSGWVLNASDFREPWMKAREFFPASDHFCLEWESKNVIRLGHFLGDRMKSEIGEMAARTWVKSVVVGAGAGAAVWPWAVTKTLMDLDNDWSVIMERVKLAGKCLASVIADSQEIGNRPVTLCGHSMGAAVIFSCLLELYKVDKFHVVKDVILLGAPISRNDNLISRLGASTEMWAQARAVVNGRFVNGYSSADWLLAFLFRYMEKRLFVAGLQPIEGVPGVENVDLSSIINSHEEYPHKSDLILHYTGFH